MLCNSSGRCRSYRSEAVAVQTVSVMIPLDPEVTVGNSNVSVFVAQSPEGRQKERFCFKLAFLNKLFLVEDINDVEIAERFQLN